jgi:hypothetical protein
MSLRFLLLTVLGLGLFGQAPDPTPADAVKKASSESLILGQVLVSPSYALVVIRQPTSSLGQRFVSLIPVRKDGQAWQTLNQLSLDPGMVVSPVSDQRAVAAQTVIDTYIRNDWTSLSKVTHPQAVERFKQEMSVICESGQGACAKLFAVTSSEEYKQLEPAVVYQRFFANDYGAGGFNAMLREPVVLGIVSEGSDLAHAVMTFKMKIRNEDKRLLDVITLRRSANGSWLGDSRFMIEHYNRGTREVLTEQAARRSGIKRDRDEALKLKEQELRRKYQEAQKQQ